MDQNHYGRGSAMELAPLAVYKRGRGQFAVARPDGVTIPPDMEWEDYYVEFFGYFGSIGPHVFAAAPDLLEAVVEAELYVETLHSLVAAKDTRAQVMGVIKRMRAAIAKARGQRDDLTLGTGEGYTLALFAQPMLAVKPLEWRDHGPDSFPEPAWSAQTPFGFYNIEEVSASDNPAYVVRLHAHHFIGDKESLADAKAAAQADYEQRIRSALAPAEGLGAREDHPRRPEPTPTRGDARHGRDAKRKSGNAVDRSR